MPTVDFHVPCHVKVFFNDVKNQNHLMCYLLGIYTFVCGAPHTCILYYVSKIVDDQFYPLKKKKKRERERKKNDN